MWLRFSRYVVLLAVMAIPFVAYAQTDTSSTSPYFIDSILKNKVDTAKWMKVIKATTIHKPAGKYIIVQAQKHPDKSLVFLYVTTILLLLLVFIRVMFDDFFHAILEGVTSKKKFYIFYKSKKYDSLLAVFLIYLFKIAILALVVYIGINYFQKDDFTTFHLKIFFNIWALLSIFFITKNVTEYIFNWVIGTLDIFNASFLSSLFAEFILSVLLLIVFMVYIYNTHISYGFMLTVLVLSVSVYVVFNIIRSYQLISNRLVNYKLHFFLYICAFKIIPFLILTKYILNNIV